jgi:uncharacterized protein YndB with AHSA1/START domain/ankyrin repeat protein
MVDLGEFAAMTIVRVLDASDPLALAVVTAIRAGDVSALARLLLEHPDLAGACLRGERSCDTCRSLLHVATDWPGHFPNVTASIATLVRAGADVNARFNGKHPETPLHWAASSNDVAALDALLDAGADIEATGAVIGGGSPLADARGFGQWPAAYRLVARGARVTLVDAATLGLIDQLRALCSDASELTIEQATSAFWGACHGGQQAAAEYLRDRNADINWIGHGGFTPLDVAQEPSARELVGEERARHLIAWLRAQGAVSARELGSNRKAMDAHIAHETFVVEIVVDANPATVFAAYADVHARQEWSAPGGDAIVYDVDDFRVGGGDKYRCGPQGALSFAGAVWYQEIVADKCIVFVESVRDASRTLSLAMVTWELLPEGNATRLRSTTQMISFVGPQMVAASQSGTRAALNNLAAWCARRQS